MQRSYLNPRSVERGTIHRLPLVHDSISLGGVDQPSLIENASNFDGVGDQTSRIKVNLAQLQHAEDWEERVRRLGIQLLREASSPSLRASTGVAHAYLLLSRDLFSASFVCCWKELSEPYRINLVYSLEAAVVADVSSEILQALLNLAKFREQDPSGGLPIDVPTLANLSLRCRAYAKALHYKDREYSMSGSNACVEALISINRKPDLQEAALGTGYYRVADNAFRRTNVENKTKVASRSTTGFRSNKRRTACSTVLYGVRMIEMMLERIWP